MGRTVATLWQASFAIAAGVLYFFFVLPRWPELMGSTTHTLGTVLRIVAGVLIALAALPVVFTLLRTRKPEYGTPQLALTLRTWSIVAHVAAGVLIVGTAVSEIWLDLDAVGQWLFAVYGAAAAVAILGISAFYLSFVAELPPPPPKPIKPKKPKRRLRRKAKKAAEAEIAETAETEVDETEKAEGEKTETEKAEAETAEAEPEPATAKADEQTSAEEPESTAEEPPSAEEPPAAEDTVATEASRGGLRNRRPTGKTRRRRSRRGVAVED
ncbi:hypothetical protein [Mycobacterium shimoidei]|uniref:hypothetical protein n=1 Tax=Mycobacterium shimoidei TaxID=29313 RepID=UPI000848A08A|nr:hypothetical protein [Mycobacterium shimoidei]MCV7259613.1 hypothetical protein [Mycobacterium shimoidei]ODR12188.1 hypothetical protein BHQ16_16690 [Mycobacterium shimoidei]ORW78010.1 hypothetical protein AWC26_18460 [Mycobacterium shimoidei]